MPQEPEIDWRNVVDLIQRGDPAGEEILYRTLLRGARKFLQRRLGTQDVDDRVHDVFLIVAGAIHRGDIQHPEHLMAFVRTVLYLSLIHISEPTRLGMISYAVFCLKKKTKHIKKTKQDI